MSDDSFHTFLSRLENDAGLRQELRAAGFDADMRADALIAFAARKGCAFRVDDDGELTDQQLDVVAGGNKRFGDGGSSVDSKRLQTDNQRWDRCFATISNVMKKMSQASDTIISNIK